MLAVLRNPVCVGKFAEGDGTRPGCHDGIVPPEMFEDVQLLLDQRRAAPSDAGRHWHDFSLRGKVVRPKCRRPLATYKVSHRLPKVSAVIYRYYRCRSTAGGRPPCRGVQYPAGEVERFVRGLLTQPATWRQIADDQLAVQPGHAEALRSIRCGLDEVTQDRLLPTIIDRVEFRRRNTVARVTLSPQIAGIVTGYRKTT